MLASGWMNAEEIAALGVQAEEGVLIDRTARLFGGSRIRIGRNSRIDAFCVLSAGPKGIDIGKHCHVASGCKFLGQELISMEDYSGFSVNVTAFSSSDSYTEPQLAGPTIPEEWRAVENAPVYIGRAAIVGASSVILPGVRLGTASSVGALTFVRRSVPDFHIISGNPPRKVGERDPSILDEIARFEALRGY